VRPSRFSNRGPGPVWQRGDARRPHNQGPRSTEHSDVSPPPPVDPLKVAEQVIASADSAHPADVVLRATLKAQIGLSRDLSAYISRTVFAYYRWHGWLDQSQPVSQQIRRAVELAEQFSREPSAVGEDELVARSVPHWVRNELKVTPAWARALQTEPRLWLRARPGQGRALAEKLQDCRPFAGGLLPDSLEYLGIQDLFRTAAFQAGDFEMQDLSSQAVGLLCAPQTGETWWDACAGEGGKLLHLSDLMQNKGLIWGSDRAEWRLRILKRRAARAKVFNYRLVDWDGGLRLPTKTSFDGVLVDAPCSGLGTWHRNPHARWTIAAQDVRELGEAQYQLLSHAAPAVKPGGKLVYAVCTLTRRETKEVASRFQERFPEFEPLAQPNPLAPESAPAPAHCLWPQDFGGNGMFVACWRRKA
jgi:16S rRNA (cytosine967-C5)-methyltransferase